MKITIERNALLKTLGHATAIVERRNTIPILGNVLIEAAAADTAKLVATDLDLQVTQAVDARIEEGFGAATTVSAHLLNDAIRELPGGCQVELSQEEEGDGRLAVVGGRTRYQLPTLPAQDFPIIAPEDEAVEFELASAVLAALLTKVMVAQSRDNVAQPHLCGVHFRAIDGRLALVATDRNFLAEGLCGMPDEAEQMPPATLPAKFTGELHKLVAEADGSVTMRVGARRATITAGDVELTGKLLEGSFLEWRRAFPAEAERRLLIGRESFAGAIRRAMVVCSDKTRIVKIELSRDKLVASGLSHEKGSAVEEAPASYDAAELTVGFNSAHLLAALGVIKSDEVQVDFGNDDGRALIVNPNDSSARWMIGASRV